MKVKNFFFAAVLGAAVITSCSDDNVDPTPQPQNTEEAELYLSLASPTTYAADDQATDAEVILKAVDVFIYEGNALTHHTQLALGDFSISGANEYVTKNPILTTAGQKTIYVGVNLVDKIVNSILANAQLSGVRQVVDVVIGDLVDSNSGIAMMGVKAGVELYPINDPLHADPNRVTVDVERLVAKISVEKSATLRHNIEGGSLASDIQFSVRKVNTKIYPAQQKNSSGVVIDPNFYNDGYLASEFVNPYNYISVAAYSSTNNGKTLPSQYAVENTSQDQERFETTFVSIKTIFTPDSVTSAAGVKTEYTGGVTSFWTVTVVGPDEDYVYFFLNLADAQTYYNSKISQGETASISAEYVNGENYYNMFLNIASTTNPAGVIRNEYYRARIDNIHGLGNPGPDDGNEVKTYANLDLTVNILPWTTIITGYDLTK